MRELLSMPNRKISTSDALLEATKQAMLREPGMIVIGEGVSDPKAIFGTTSGLLEEFGPRRVIETPIAENGLTGIAIGAALSGLKPLFIHQRVEFALLALEQIFNNAAKMHYVTNGKHTVPLTIRLIFGRGWGQGPAHSQSLESIFAHIPGLKVLLPSNPYDAKGMLSAAMKDPNPVVMLEHRWIHSIIGEVPEADYDVSLSGFKKIRSGTDATIVASSYFVAEALRVAEVLEGFNVNISVIDMRVLRPFDASIVIEDVKKTGHLVVVDSGWRDFGAGAEVISTVVESAFRFLEKPPVRLGLAPHPTPSTRSLAEHFYPTMSSLSSVIAELLEFSEQTSNSIRKIYSEISSRAKFDVPNPHFKGPF